jgi:hypothetical protein
VELRWPQRLSLDAAIWGIPILNFDAMRQAYFRDAGARYNDIIWWPKGSSWRNQSLTPNTDIGFEGKGGKYLILPPDYIAEVPPGYPRRNATSHSASAPIGRRPR